MAVAALLVLGLFIHFWQPIEPKGPKAEDFPVLVESKYGKLPYPFRVEFPACARCRLRGLLGPARVRLSRGESLCGLYSLPPRATSPSGN